MSNCIICGRRIKSGVVGSTCAKKLKGPRPDSALSMVRLLNRLKHEANKLNIKVEYDFKSHSALCVPLVHSPSIDNARAEIIEKINYYMEAHKFYSADAVEQYQMGVPELA